MTKTERGSGLSHWY